ncbi:MAG: alpha/beta fold hydrolase [Pigmentiphaga sp.]|uniref:alpha/beta hydrolase n=1 Tax=Pigmentiphaga sp. TaxID=1977564 RepID=UPI0029A22B95|nr:alpha/beta fold hydrolase [Pigmentiphaga sp.]MDX3904284.1 alpha/beta fold hydrolase [Pigmentiphaga sp.]
MKTSRNSIVVAFWAAVGLAALLTAAACAGGGQKNGSARPASFDAYRQEMVQMLQQRRAFQSSDSMSELAWNAPREWRPEKTPQRGVLLVHGLGDSPWSFHDVGKQLADDGFLVRAILLPGHGTRPEDMLDVTLEDWRRVVAEQAAALRHEVEQIYLGGFSTGANLVLDYAYAHADVAGLLLFSPAFKSNSAYDWLTPLIAWARPWLLEPDNVRPMQNAVRYMTVPTNGFVQFYRSSVRARDSLRKNAYDKPTLMVVAEHDSVLATAYLSKMFSSRFTHPASRLIWYGDSPGPESGDPRIVVRKDKLPELRISQFSHMGLLFSPDNELYGAEGRLRLCWNGQTEPARLACEQGAPVWFSEWGYREAGKIHARLTFNPYFKWQSRVMREVLAASSEVGVAVAAR